MGGHNKAQGVAQNDLNLQQQTLGTAGSTSIPYVTSELQKSAGVLDQIRAGNFGSLPMVQAVNQGANAAMNWRPQAMGDAALASGEAGAGGGYATQQEAYRKRLIGAQVANLMPQAVEAERSNAEQELFPGAQTVSGFDLSRAGGYGAGAGAATGLYSATQANSFFGNLKNSFANSVGKSLGSFGFQNAAGTMGMGGFG